MPADQQAPCGDKLALACDVAEQHFGTVPKLVVERLLYQGPASVQQLAAYCSSHSDQGLYNAQRLRRAMIVLIHHGLVHFKVAAPPVYYCLPDAVLMRLRHPMLIQQAQALFGDDGALITKRILHHGRLTAPALLDVLINDPTSPCTHLPQDRLEKKIESLKSALEAMMHNNFVEYCPRPLLAAQDTENTLEGMANREAAKQRGGKVGGAKRKREEAEAKLGKKPTGQMLGRFGDEEDEWGLPQVKKEHPPDKDKDGVAKADGAPGAAASAKGGGKAQRELRVNFVQFLHHLRQKECSEVVRRLVNEHAALLVDTFMKFPQKVYMVLPSEDEIDSESYCIPAFPRYSPPTRLDSVAHTLTHSEVQRRLPELIASLETSVPHIGSHSILKKMSSTNYAVNMEAISEALLSAQMECVLGEKFGVLGRRIFKILLNKKVLEEKEIISNALDSEAEVRKKLYRMKSTGYLQVRDVPTTADNNPMKTLYLWHVPVNFVKARLVNEMYKTLRNLFQRRKHEEARVKNLLTRRESGLTEHEQELMSKYQTVQDTVSYNLVALYEMTLGLEFF